MKRKWIVLLLAGCLSLGMAACGGEKAEEKQESVSQEADETEQGDAKEESAAVDFDAKAFVETLISGDAASLEEAYAFTDAMTSALSAQGGLAGLQEQIKTLGALTSMEDAKTAETNGGVSYSVPCAFEAQSIDMIITMDAENKIAGIVMGQYTGTAGEETASLPSGLSEEELSFPVRDQDGWELSGTLTLPEGEGPFPAVVLVQGSGPSNRDEESGVNRPFRDLAWGLAQQGVAVYRYDKRTYVYAQEMAADTSLTLQEETVDDAVSAAELLRTQEKLDAEHIFILGHSLGGQALPRIEKSAGESGVSAAGYIFLAAPARALDVVTREQLDFFAALPEYASEEAKASLDALCGELDRLQQLDTLSENESVMGAYPAYWRDLLSYDQVAEAAGMTEPCLVLQGEEDYQVTMEDFGIWKDAYGSKENWQFESYPGLTHLFMTGKKSDGPAAYQEAQTVDAQVISDIAAFVKQHS